MRKSLCSILRVRFAGAFALALFILSFAREIHAAASVSNELSLARAFPIENLAKILLPRDVWQPFPVLRDRERWQALPGPVAAHLIAQGEEALGTPLPVLPATLYLAYAREGNRSRFEAVYFKRRVLLHDLVLAECVEGKGRFLEAAADALWSICEESTWCLPAHVGVQKARVGLPDVAEPIVDLFAAETGVSVAWTVYLLGAELDRVSPQIRRRAVLELQRRILNPVWERDDFGWMALNVTATERRPNNWTPWISASVLTAALLSEPDAERRVRIVHKMLRSLDGFLKFHPADGSCDEGPGYWGHAGGSLFDALELLRSASAGNLDVSDEPLVQEIGRFIYRAHIGGDYFVPIGDCAARFEPERALVFRYGERIDDAPMKALAAYGAKAESLLGSRFLGRELAAVFAAEKILGARPAAPPLVRDVWLPSEDLQMMAARAKEGSAKGFYVAAWGGHNAQSHNHNDVGNFLAFIDGEPLFVDAGAPTYTAQTFSAKRYDHWAFQSSFHNLPTINGVMQGVGRQFKAQHVRCETNDAVAQLQMDLAPAYPAAAKVASWIRTVRLNRGENIEITDAFQLSEALGGSALNFLTPLEAAADVPGRIRLSSGTEGARAAKATLVYDPTKLTPSVERIELTDARLSNSWGSHLNRLILRERSPKLQDTWTVRVERGE